MAPGDSNAEFVRLDLRSGRTVWELHPIDALPSAPVWPRRADIIIVGAGITGAFLAERLTRLGRDVVVIDRHAPHTASTAASTSLLQWEIDAPMLELEERLGFETAAHIYQRSFAAVRTIGALVHDLQLAVAYRPRPSLYLAGDALDAKALKEEGRLRALAHLPSVFCDRDALSAQWGFARDAALASEGSAEANPVALAHALLGVAVQRGARLLHPATVAHYDFGFSEASIETIDGRAIAANCIILANGYEMPPFVPATVHRIVSTWALATPPQAEPALWPRRALVWEASEPYAYLRTNSENRIIIGGEDEALTDAALRDAKTPAKTQALLRKLEQFLPGVLPEAAAAWTGFFGETADGLPLIGAVPGMPRCYAAFGYGGNGVTFSALAAELIGKALTGERDSLLDIFALDRSAKALPTI